MGLSPILQSCISKDQLMVKKMFSCSIYHLIKCCKAINMWCYKSRRDTRENDHARCKKDKKVFLGNILRLWVHYEALKDTFTVQSLLCLWTFESFEASPTMKSSTEVLASSMDLHYLGTVLFSTNVADQINFKVSLLRTQHGVFMEWKIWPICADKLTWRLSLKKVNQEWVILSEI